MQMRHPAQDQSEDQIRPQTANQTALSLHGGAGAGEIGSPLGSAPGGIKTIVK